MTEVDYITLSKACTRCSAVKPATNEYFSKCKRGIYGLNAWCKACCAQQKREDRAARPEHYAELERRRHERHGEARKEANRILWEARKDQYREAAKPRIAAKRADYNAARQIVRASDPDKHNARNKAWRDANKEKLNADRREKWKTVPIKRRLRVVIGAGMAHSLKGRTKGGKGWQTIVGYTTADLMAHLERQFVNGMTWDNYGTHWHVDHIIPVASFKYESVDDEGFKACWAISNLRPLCAKENLSKRAKVLYLL